MAETFFVGVDVGTGSVRAALVDSTGQVHKVHVRETKTWNPLPDHYEQSSDNIWSGICECVQVSISCLYNNSFAFFFSSKNNFILIFFQPTFVISL